MKLLVTGCGRTGTQYLTRILSGIGLSVTHEKVFNHDLDPWNPDLEEIKRRQDLCDIEISWLAVPFLHLLNPRVVIWHQVRDPLKSLPCWTQHFLLNSEETHAKLVHKVLDETKKGSNLQRSVTYLYKWNKLIDLHFFRRNDFQSKRRFKIEDLTCNKLAYWLAEAGFWVDPVDIQKVMNDTPKNVGTCGEGFHKKITWDDLLEIEYGYQLEEMAKEYGYSYEE